MATAEEMAISTTWLFSLEMEKAAAGRRATGNPELNSQSGLVSNWKLGLLPPYPAAVRALICSRIMPLGLSGCCQDRATLFRDVFSFRITVTGEGAGSPTVTVVLWRPVALGRKWTLLRQGSQRRLPPLLPLAASPRQRLHRTLKVASRRPPESSGQLQSRITEVSFMEEITFRGAEGGPGGEEDEVKRLISGSCSGSSPVQETGAAASAPPPRDPSHSPINHPKSGVDDRQLKGSAVREAKGWSLRHPSLPPDPVLVFPLLSYRNNGGLYTVLLIHSNLLVVKEGNTTDKQHVPPKAVPEQHVHTVLTCHSINGYRLCGNCLRPHCSVTTGTPRCALALKRVKTDMASL
ncbi:hypothetical protein EYF80_010399 [Liparis tanakae]|uniref:Uncharacterized protein n=1 Tax=Liparis tanakae TaxID=230148 RepID=A0A4Z2INE3_9TELE|nr:hypothetical protein EYF80_010399 [Liparis tanakae]